MQCKETGRFTISPFYRKSRVCQQEVNFLSTNSQLLVDKKLEVCNILIIRDDFFLYKKDIRTYILLVFSCLDHYLKLHCLLWMRTSNVITHNITCTGSHHYLFSDQIFLKKNLIILHKNNFFFFQSFSFSRAPCSSAFRLKLPT